MTVFEFTRSKWYLEMQQLALDQVKSKEGLQWFIFIVRGGMIPSLQE